MFRRVETIPDETAKGTYVEISDEIPGYGMPVFDTRRTNKTVAVTLTEIDWIALEASDTTLKTRTFVDDNGVQRIAALVPVFLKL